MRLATLWVGMEMLFAFMALCRCVIVEGFGKKKRRKGSRDNINYDQITCEN